MYPPPEDRFAPESDAQEMARDRRRMITLIAGFAVFVLIAGGILAARMLQSVAQVEEMSGKEGMLALMQYGHTRQRLLLISLIAQRYYMEQGGESDPSAADLIRLGADPGMFLDKWGRDMRLESAMLTSAGDDGRFGNEDDLWLNLRTGELGGYFPDARVILENSSSVPPEARTLLQQQMRQQEEMRARMEQIEREAEAVETPATED